MKASPTTTSKFFEKKQQRRWHQYFILKGEFDAVLDPRKKALYKDQITALLSKIGRADQHLMGAVSS